MKKYCCINGFEHVFRFVMFTNARYGEFYSNKRDKPIPTVSICDRPLRALSKLLLTSTLTLSQWENL